MNKLYFIGDLHGNFHHLMYMLKNIKNAYLIQVGDFGIGFNGYENDKDILDDLNLFLRERGCVLYAIRGNHDNPSFFDGSINLDCLKLIKDYSVINFNGWGNILFIGGGISIDRVYRIEESRGTSKIYWWPDEKVVYDLDKLESFRDIDIVVTHTAPNYCYPDNTNGFPPIVKNFFPYDPTLESELMEERNLVGDMFDILKKNNNIKHHYYGHFHSNKTEIKDNVLHNLIGISVMVELKKS
jgi:DNA repair exonuclease SbcCD nuclease subunit